MTDTLALSWTEFKAQAQELCAIWPEWEWVDAKVILNKSQRGQGVEVERTQRCFSLVGATPHSLDLPYLKLFAASFAINRSQQGYIGGSRVLRKSPKTIWRQLQVMRKSSPFKTFRRTIRAAFPYLNHQQARMERRLSLLPASTTSPTVQGTCALWAPPHPDTLILNGAFDLVSLSAFKSLSCSQSSVTLVNFCAPLSLLKYTVVYLPAFIVLRHLFT